MSHIPYTILRNNTYYYNRRVPYHAIKSYGKFLRYSIGKCSNRASEIAKQINVALDCEWQKSQIPNAIDIENLISSSTAPLVYLSEVADEYISLKKIHRKPSALAISTLVSLVGDRPISEYTRADAKLFVSHLTRKGNCGATIKRRVGSLSGIFSYAYSELEIEKRNPFSRLLISNNSNAQSKRGVFELDRLEHGYKLALESRNGLKLLMPILGETGCRLAEIVGLRIQDVRLSEGYLIITPNRKRRLKTKGSERIVPLVGCAKSAMSLLLERYSSEDFVFARYNIGNECRATHASNALNKWLKREFNGLTAHCLRHTYRDRLRAVECPIDLVDELGGWSAAASVGNRYGKGYKFETKLEWIEKISIKL